MRTRLMLQAVPTLAFALAIAAATTAWAQEARPFDVAPLAAKATPPVTDAGSAPLINPPRRIFDVAPLAAAAQAPAATTSQNEHQFGVGLTAGGVGGGIGGTVRYFFYGGPLGVQGEVWRFGYDLGPQDWSSTQFFPSVIYRFREYQFEAPLSLTPYAGAGLSFIHYSFDDDDFFDALDVDETDVGLLLYGGVELFFQNVPRLGVSGQLTINTNDDILTTSIGGAAFTAAAHWYFW